MLSNFNLVSHKNLGFTKLAKKRTLNAVSNDAAMNLEYILFCRYIFYCLCKAFSYKSFSLNLVSY